MKLFIIHITLLSTLFLSAFPFWKIHGKGIFNVTFPPFCWMHNLKSMTLFFFLSSSLFVHCSLYGSSVLLDSLSSLPLPGSNTFLGFTVFYGSFPLFLWSSFHSSLLHVPTVTTNTLHFPPLFCLSWTSKKSQGKKKKKKAGQQLGPGLMQNMPLTMTWPDLLGPSLVPSFPFPVLLLPASSSHCCPKLFALGDGC